MRTNKAISELQKALDGLYKAESLLSFDEDISKVADDTAKLIYKYKHIVTKDL